MWHTSHTAGRCWSVGLAWFVLLAGLLLGSAARGQSIDLSLNLFYNDPQDDQSGGTWQVVAKTSDEGLAALGFYLTDIVAPAPQPVGPRGTVNGSDPAGFSEFNVFSQSGAVGFALAQVPLTDLAGGQEQSIFYGVGTTAQGAPGTVGPDFDSLANVAAVPWAAGNEALGDPEWETAALLAAGSFNPGQMPDFATGAGLQHTGSVYTSVGTSTSVGSISGSLAASVEVRQFAGVLGDYNNNGLVDAADYTVWRDHLGQSITLPNEGVSPGTVDQDDYALWKANFGTGMLVGSGSGALGSGSAVPEPAAATLLLGACGIAVLRCRGRLFHNV